MCDSINSCNSKWIHVGSTSWMRDCGKQEDRRGIPENRWMNMNALPRKKETRIERSRCVRERANGYGEFALFIDQNFNFLSSFNLSFFLHSNSDCCCYFVCHTVMRLGINTSHTFLFHIASILLCICLVYISVSVFFSLNEFDWLKRFRQSRDRLQYWKYVHKYFDTHLNMIKGTQSKHIR